MSAIKKEESCDATPHVADCVGPMTHSWVVPGYFECKAIIRLFPVAESYTVKSSGYANVFEVTPDTIEITTTTAQRMIRVISNFHRRSPYELTIVERPRDMSQGYNSTNPAAAEEKSESIKTEDNKQIKSEFQS